MENYYRLKIKLLRFCKFFTLGAFFIFKSAFILNFFSFTSVILVPANCHPYLPLKYVSLLNYLRQQADYQKNSNLVCTRDLLKTCSMLLSYPKQPSCLHFNSLQVLKLDSTKYYKLHHLHKQPQNLTVVQYHYTKRHL